MLDVGAFFIPDKIFMNIFNNLDDISRYSSHRGYIMIFEKAKDLKIMILPYRVRKRIPHT